MTTEFRADLHCHSTCSDGSLHPEKLIELAAERGLKGLSITDHDTIEAYATALPAAEKKNIQLISGVEFSTVLDNANVHILAYSFPLQNPLIHDFCSEHHKRRSVRNKAILELLSKKGMPLTEEELLNIVAKYSPNGHKKIIGRPHIALAMVQKGYVQNMQQAFKKFIGEGCSCYVQGDYFSPEETIDLIHKLNGFAVIAHPHLIDDSKTIIKLLSMNFDGLECYYSMFSNSHNERWIKIAQKRNWLMTGGSDFHGEIKPLVALGCSWVGEEPFRILHERFIANI